MVLTVNFSFLKYRKYGWQYTSSAANSENHPATCFELPVPEK